METKSDLSDQFQLFTTKYLESNAKIKVSSHLLTPLNQKTPHNSSFWKNSAQYLSMNQHINAESYFAVLITTIACALDTKHFEAWHSLNFSQQQKELFKLIHTVKEFERTLAKWPSDSLNIQEDSSQTGLAIHLTRFGRAKKQESLAEKHRDFFTQLKCDIALKLKSLLSPNTLGTLTQAPPKQTKNTLQTQLIQELIVLFKSIGIANFHQLIIDLCHIYEFYEVDELTIKRAVNKANKKLETMGQ
ncbi:hypothetical protein [Vibrio diabolicus]|uniref:hypothetical protein n=1 Tax=Vibrio diabolicus TaxID=50719 RepID=UPI00211ACDD3|nr:hypothetical protein [Vibrio diabolicus]